MKSQTFEIKTQVLRWSQNFKMIKLNQMKKVKSLERKFKIIR